MDDGALPSRWAEYERRVPSSLEDLRGQATGLVDLHAAAGVFSYIDLERLARRHEPDLALETILDHLAGVSVFPDEDFAEYELGEAEIADLRRWVTGWHATWLAVSPRNSPMSFRTTYDGTDRTVTVTNDRLLL